MRAIRQFALGPWPLRFGAMWALLSIMVTFIGWRLLGPHALLREAIATPSNPVTIVLTGLLGPALVLVPLVAYMRLRRRVTTSPMRSLEYLLLLLLASLLGSALVRFSVRFDPNFYFLADDPVFALQVIRWFCILLLFNAILGTLSARIQRESDTAQVALQTVVVQRRLLLESEERVRGQVAAYLHDRVQTDLVSIGLRIRAAVAFGSAELVRDVDDALADLERVRAEEIRRASRQLSPNLTQVTLDAALRELAMTYRPGMTVTILVSDAAARELGSGSDLSHSIGMYRICEQGLLNAAIHGHATECSISILVAGRDELLVEVRDNGVGLPPTTPLVPGMGSTVISAWVEALGGHWRLEPASVGVTLTAVVPAR